MRTILGSLALLFLATSLVSACSCTENSACPELGSLAHPVFVGSVLHVTELPATSDLTFLSSRKARLRLKESFGGLASDQSEIDVFTGAGANDCGISFRPGETWLVAASLSKDGLMRASICSATRRLDEAGAALRVLRDRRDRHIAPSLAGQVLRVDRNFTGTLGSHTTPVPGTLVRVRSRGKSFETVADSDGAFAFYDLPRGTYEFDPDLPPGTTLYWYIGGEKHLRPVDLDGAGCRKENIEVFSSGSIEGRVLGSNNQPFSEVSVYLVPVSTLDLSNRWRLYWESQSKQGVFKFVHVPPGEYLVLVNPEDSTTDNFPYRRTFHPGVHDRSEAGVITVSPGQQVNNVDIQLR